MLVNALTNDQYICYSIIINFNTIIYLLII